MYWASSVQENVKTSIIQRGWNTDQIIHHNLKLIYKELNELSTHDPICNDYWW